MRAWAVIAALDERDAIGVTLAALPHDLCEGAVVVDGGSRDGTADVARGAGAMVVTETRRGYGRAMMRGVAHAEARGARAFLMLDGNGRLCAGDIRRVLAPLLDGQAELVIGARRGADLRPVQRLGNRFAVGVIHRAFGVRFQDVGSIRAVGAAALRALELDEAGYGWPLQLQVRAARRALRTLDVPITPGPRRGRSKVSGTLRGTAGASLSFLRILATECRP